MFATATMALLSRLLSPAEYGVYVLGMAIATAASGVLFQWLNVSVGRFYLVHLDDPIKVMGVASLGFWVASAGAALLYIGVFLFQNVIGVDPFMVSFLFLVRLALGSHALTWQLANAQGKPLPYRDFWGVVEKY